MFGKKKRKENKFSFKSDNYQMKNSYNSDKLIVANLEYVSNEPTRYGPIVKRTEQKYIFEILNEDGKIRYREIFTGFIADANESHYFNLPYVVNIVSLKEQVTSVGNNIPKYSLLLVLNELNKKHNTQRMKKK